jgi:hypothetical protein
MMKVDFCSINRSLLCPFSGAFRVTSLSHENQWGSKASFHKRIELNSIGLKARRATGCKTQTPWIPFERERSPGPKRMLVHVWCIFMEYKTWLCVKTWYLMAGCSSLQMEDG